VGGLTERRQEVADREKRRSGELSVPSEARMSEDYFDLHQYR
jgi:hypothetical protein